MRLHGIDDAQLNELREDLDAYGCIAILKTNKPIGSDHIAQCFSSVKLNKSDIKRLNSIEARKHPDFGDLDSSIPVNRRKFFYSFPVVVEDVDSNLVMEDSFEEFLARQADRYSSIEHIEQHGTRGMITVKDFMHMFEKVPQKHKDAIVNFAPSDKIFGQVNDVFIDDTDDGRHCIFTLAPYRNGQRFKDCSINGNRHPPIMLSDICNSLKGISPSTVIKVRYTDPLAFGPKSGQIVDMPIDSITLDKLMGIFLRTSEDVEPTVVSAL